MPFTVSELEPATVFLHVTSASRSFQLPVQKREALQFRKGCHQEHCRAEALRFCSKLRCCAEDGPLRRTEACCMGRYYFTTAVARNFYPQVLSPTAIEALAGAVRLGAWLRLIPRSTRICAASPISDDLRTRFYCALYLFQVVNRFILSCQVRGISSVII